SAPADDTPQVPPGSPFEKFFHDFMDQQNKDNQPKTPQRGEALGSGFVISEDGYIVTNNHVIEGADDIQVQFLNGDQYKAKVVGVDKATDIALLKVKADKPLPYVPFGDSTQMRVGDWVMAMGNPLGQGFSVTAGIISAKGRTLHGSYDGFFQAD
ncbi:trypsin-like serine protease, partial [Thioclava sp. BHET1]